MKLPMKKNIILEKIKKEFFYGSQDYTKNQPDLFLPHKFQILPPSESKEFLQKVKESIVENEILIYIHLPFCFSKCLFCNSFPYEADKDNQKNYLDSLLHEIEIFSDAGVFEGKKAKCIYFGGGTPTSFSNNAIKRIIEKISSVITVPKNCNITSEAHPSTLADEKRIEELKEIGINRISIGCQTFAPYVLKLCNRKNTEAQIKRIVRIVQEMGISINIDMMTGLPGQTLEDVKNDLNILEKIRPDSIEYIRHEIVNPLMIDLYKKRPELIIENDILFQMVYTTQKWMQKNGYEQNGRFTNKKHWEYRYYWLKEMPIIAFGPRTRSYTKTICYDKHEELSTYMRLTDKGLSPVGRYFVLTKKEQMYRSLILGLQIKTGIDTKVFQDRFNEDPNEIFAELFNKLKEYSCITQQKNTIRLTEYGACFVEDVCDLIIDTALKEESPALTRAPHSAGKVSSRLKK